MKQHYETLGVPEDASAEEIKRAFLNRAKASHPDKKGGDQDEMMAINHAFDVLGDPKRRLLYDATGQDNQRPIGEQVRGLLMSGFQNALSKGSRAILEDVRWFIKEAEAKTVESQRESRKAIKELQARRKKIKCKDENVFHMIVDKEIQNLKQNIAVMDEGLKVVEAAFKALDEYESSEKEPERAQPLMYVFGQSSSTTGNW